MTLVLPPSSITPGFLHLIKGTPNPNGAQQTGLFLLEGDATAMPVQQIVPQEDVCLPPPRGDLPPAVSPAHSALQRFARPFVKIHRLRTSPHFFQNCVAAA
jgi:hypothetical protein